MIRFREFWGLRILALTLALILWFVFSIDKREHYSEKVFEVSVTYNTPNDIILLSPIGEVAVRLRGPSSRLRALTPFQVNAIVDVEEDRLGTSELLLGPNNIDVPEGFEVVSIEPSLISLRTDARAQALISVEPTLVGEAAAGAIVTVPTVDPEMVLVTGPQESIKRLRMLRTTEIDLTSHAITFVQTAAVVSPDPLVQIVNQTVVRVTIPMTIRGTTETDEEPTPE